MSKKLKYALIGCGRIAPNHIGAAKDCSGIEIAALCDLHPERCQKLIEQFHLSNVEVHTDFRQMLREQPLDLAAIATESGKHAAVALECIRHQVHVIIEKPMALSLRDADAILEAAKRYQVRVCACHQNRFNKSVTKLKSAIESGLFGPLYHLTANVRWNRGEEYYRQAPWRGRWDQDGGALMNQCIHNIDLLRWLAAEPILEVFAYTDRLHHPYIQAEDLGIALVKFKNDTYGVIEGTTNVYPKNYEETLCVFGQRGTAKIGGKSVNQLETFLVAGFEGEEEWIREHYSETPQNIYGFGHKPLYRDVVDAIKCGREPLVDGQAGRDALELVLGIYLSAAEGVPVRFPLEDCASVDFADRFS